MNKTLRVEELLLHLPNHPTIKEHNYAAVEGPDAKEHTHHVSSTNKFHLSFSHQQKTTNQRDQTVSPGPLSDSAKLPPVSASASTEVLDTAAQALFPFLASREAAATRHHHLPIRALSLPRPLRICRLWKGERALESSRRR
jgi:acyl transferase domain-containing protein